MSGKKEKEKRFDEWLNGTIQAIHRIDVKADEVLLIEINPKVDQKTFAQMSRAFKSSFEENRVKILFGPTGVVKKVTAVRGVSAKGVLDPKHHVAIKEEQVNAAKQEGGNDEVKKEGG